MAIKIKMFDASSPPKLAPFGYQVAAGYIGGDTPHVWTPAEWLRFSRLARLPIFVRSDPQSHDPVQDAFIALRQLYYLGVPHRVAVALDLETAIDPVYVHGFGGVMHWGGYRVWPYGSASTLFRNPVLDGYWVADYRGIGPFMNSHPRVRATQYMPGPVVDSSLVKYWSYKHRLWAPGS